MRTEEAIFLRAALHVSRGACGVVRATKVLLFLSFLFLPGTLHAISPTSQELEEALTCQCSCGLTVHSCNHLQCGFAVPAKERIAKSVSQGQSKESILAAFVAEYGEKVLSAPTTTGFNLAAWITPFLALLLGGIIVGLFGLRWSRRRASITPQTSPTSEVTDEYRERLKKELDTFEA
jgi:cytochrome c-type biogenesis protein CcmH/NrfF